MTTRTFRLLAWLAFAALVFATLSPIGLRPRGPWSVDVERSGAFLVAGLLFALAYPRHIWLAAGLVLMMVFGLEWLQHIRPDRHGQWHDAFVKAGGAVLGLAGGWLLARRLRLKP